MSSRSDWRSAAACLVPLLLVAIVSGCSPSGSRAGAKASIQNKGSDTMIELAQAWAEAYSGASVEVSGGGSGVGVSSLITGTVDIANSSRLMSKSELADAKKKTRKDPVLHVVGHDALAVYVHKGNPLEEITMEQLAQIYGDKGTITKWSQLGIKVPGCDNDEILRVSRQNNSGTYEYFKEAVLGEGHDYKLGTIDASGSKDLVKLVANTPCAIGYSGMGYKTPEVKFLRVKGTGKEGILPSVEAVHAKTYPISRPLYMYTLGEATGHLMAYIDWVRSDAGQEVLARVGYVPLQPAERAQAPR